MRFRFSNELSEENSDGFNILMFEIKRFTMAQY